ncbi:MAG: prenyltransferase [Chloroflexi bacterium]|nr:prenyltransferase [Chloroflexota bacterium]
MNWIYLFLSLARPVYLLGTVFLYSLGAGIAKYLGVTIHWLTFFYGLAWILLIQIGGLALFDYFEPEKTQLVNDNKKPNNYRSVTDEKTNALIRVVTGFTCLAAAGSISILLMQTNRLTLTTSILMIMAFLGMIFFSLPPFRLAYSGYGELLIAILFANLIPALSFVLQTEELHRLVAMTTFPLMPLLLAMIIAFEFPAYSNDLKNNKRKLIIRMGWQRAMILHNLLILCTYLLLAIAMIFHLPAFIGLPVFLTLPLGIFQIWQMKRISIGAKPNWSSLKISWIVFSYAIVYLLVYSYWIH